MRTPFALFFVTFLTTSVLAEPQPRDNQTVAVGPWAIASIYKADKLESCTMSRPAGDSIRLVAGSRSLDAKALAETKSVTIALADPRLNSKLRSASVFEVHGDGATLRVPLDGSSAAFERLEACFSKREATEINPFVASSRKP
jgi:hypothetical protein